MKEKILELRKKGLSVDEIVNELGCAKSTISYHLNNNSLGVKKITEELINKMNEYEILEEFETFLKSKNVTIPDSQREKIAKMIGKRN